MLLLILLSFCSCSRYVSSYSAIGLARNQSAHSCEASFLSLDGQLVFKLKLPKSENEGDISYSVELESGEIYLYYDADGTKEELAHVIGGESITDRGGYIEVNGTVYIIIEATEKAKGRVSVSLDNA